MDLDSSAVDLLLERIGPPGQNRIRSKSQAIAWDIVSSQCQDAF